MTNPAPISLDQLFRYYKDLPHQRAAVMELQAELQAEPYAWVMRRDRPWFQTWSQSGKQPDTTSSIPQALVIIKKWEGCKLTAYPDPGTGDKPWTIGFGTTRIGGKPILPGTTITQAKADALLEEEVLTVTARLGELLPVMIPRPSHERAALTSWAYNVGLGAVKDSTLRERLHKGEDPRKVIPEELPKWVKAGGKVMQGLVNRRADEVRLFLEG